MDIPILADLVIIFTLAIAVSYVCFRLGIPAILAYLATGALAGPFGLGLIHSKHEVEVLAEIGVVLLLFTIGLEFSLKKLLEIKRLVLLGGGLQVGLTILVVALIGRAFDLSLGAAIFLGMLCSLSSTAIVLKLLQERGEIDSPFGKTALGILIFQDLMIVPMMIAAPYLGGGEGPERSLVGILLGGLGVLVAVPFCARWVVPQILFRVAQTQSRELFLLSIILICFGVAWFTSYVGLSLALGAFLAGLVISESEYAHEAMSDAIPFRDAFTSFFFVSIGMLLNIRTVLEFPVFILLATFGILILKALIAGGVGLLLGLPLRAALLAGFALSQVGEFAFILSRVGTEHGVIADNHYQIFLAVSVLTMAATPFVIALAPALVERLQESLPRRLVRGRYFIPGTRVKKFDDHLLIIGFGVNGRNVSRAAKAAGIEFAVLDLNPETVQKEKAGGLPIYFGDATRAEVLSHLGVERARIVVVVINDRSAVRRIVEMVRRLSSTAHLIVRTRYVNEMAALFDLGADEVIPEEFETSVEIFSRVLSRYLVPGEEIERLVAEVRADNYEMFRSLSRRRSDLSELSARLPDLDLTVLHLGPGHAGGQTLAEINLRRRSNVTVLAIKRGDRVLSHPDGDTRIEDGDYLYLLGSSENIARASNLFR